MKATKLAAKRELLALEPDFVCADWLVDGQGRGPNTQQFDWVRACAKVCRPGCACADTPFAQAFTHLPTGETFRSAKKVVAYVRTLAARTQPPQPPQPQASPPDAGYGSVHTRFLPCGRMQFANDNHDGQALEWQELAPVLPAPPQALAPPETTVQSALPAPPAPPAPPV
jgi:hypothetical protein